MRYKRPVLLGYAAIAAIQSGSIKKLGVNFDPVLTTHTIPAYEADE
jgi:hypothetical protein